MARHRSGKASQSHRQFTRTNLIARRRSGDGQLGDYRTPLLESLEQRLLLSITGFAHTNYTILHANGSVLPAASAGPTGLSPTQIRSAYGFNTTVFGSTAGTGAGQTIAIVDAYNDPTIAADLATFDSTFGLAAAHLTVINENGGTSLPGTDPSGPGFSWAVETSLDVEYSHAAAPGANIVLIEASSDSMSDLMTAVNTARNYTGVSAVSMSWGGGEFSGEASYNSYFTTPTGHNGVTFVVASGDNGAYAANSRTLQADYPAASPNVLAVGGTTLSVSSSGTYLSESGWGSGTSSGTSGGSGGGISQYIAQPSYQHGVVTQTTTARAVPDVAMDADPNSGVSVIDSWDFGSGTPWETIGGTSMAAPIWAGLIAVIDQGRAIAGEGTLDGATQTLPQLYALPSSDFHDITTGNNGYAAGTGYDLVTGRGTPIVNLLAPAMIGTTIPTTPVPVIGSLTANPASTLAGASVTLTANSVAESSGSNTISKVAFYSVLNGVDTLIGNGTKVTGTSNWALTISTTGMAVGTYSYAAIATDSANVAGTPATATLTILAPAPANDNFASAQVLTGNSVTVTGSNVGATKQAGEPSIAGNVGGASVWYNWTATSNGTVSVNTYGSSFDTLLGVYAGTSVSSLALVTSDDDAGGTVQSAVSFTAVSGTTYHIVVDGYNSGSGAATGSIKLTLAFAPAGVGPANDNFASAQILTGNSVTVTGSNVGATKQAGEPNIAGNVGGASVWFNWTATSSGLVNVNTYGSSFDTLLGVYTGTSVSSLTLVASNDDAGGTLQSAVSFSAVSGTTYHLAVDGYNAGRGAGPATGSVKLTLATVAAPANDNFASAQVLTGTSVVVTGSNVGASKQAGEPTLAGNAGGASVWYAWQAASSGSVTISTIGSSFDTMLGVYTGTSVSSLTLVASNDDISAYNVQSSVTFHATAGTTYRIVVDGYNYGAGAATGSIQLNLSETVGAIAHVSSPAPVGSPVTWGGSPATGSAGLYGQEFDALLALLR